jgi:uncharacterized protein with HEPN domain
VSSKSAQLRLFDIFEASKILETSVLETGFEAVCKDVEKRWIMERGLEIISEASRHLPVEWKDSSPHIKWQKMADMGNRLRHGYDRTDVSLLWEIVENDVPVLVAALIQFQD